MSMTPQEMLEHLLGPRIEDTGRIANDFLGELGRAIPVESLRLLLISKQRHSRASGAFIAAETRCDLHGMLAELVALLEDDSPRICGDAIEAIGKAVRWGDREAMGRVLLGLGHSAPIVRYKTIEFVRFCPAWQFEQACRHAPPIDPHPAFSQLAELVSDWRTRLPDLIESMLLSPEPIIVRFGLALAGRPYPTIVDRFLAQASQSNDPEVGALARNWQKATNPRLRRVGHFWHSDMPD